MVETHKIGHHTISEKDEYGNVDSGFNVISDSINPITLKEQNRLKQIYDILEIPLPSRLFGYTEITIKTKELDNDKVYALFSEKPKGATQGTPKRSSFPK